MNKLENTLCQVVYTDIPNAISQRYGGVLKRLQVGNCVNALQN